MASNPNVEKAIAVIAPGYATRTTREDVEKLDAAGLLASPLAQRAMEACVAHHCYYVLLEKHGPNDKCSIVSEVGREILASRKPKERWTLVKCAASTNAPWWVVVNESLTAVRNGAERVCECGPFTTEQAAIFARNALNALESA